MENKELIDRAIEYIQANPKENLSLQCIADNAGFSLTYFDAIFQKCLCSLFLGIDKLIV